jgi:excisionase family DNA binding protein
VKPDTGQRTWAAEEEAVRWMKAEEACRYAGGISKKTLYGAIRAGHLQAGRIGAGRNVLVSDIAIDRWLERTRLASDLADEEQWRRG